MVARSGWAPTPRGQPRPGGGQWSAPFPSEGRAMTQRTAADLRDALLATRDLASARAARRAVTRPAAPLPTSTDHRRFERAVSAALAKGGVDAEEWDSEVAKARAVDRRRAEALKADAVQHSGARARQLAEGIEGRRKALDLLSNMTHAPAPAQYDALHSPFLVWGSTGLSLLSSTIEPWSSRAKFSFEASLGPSSAHIESIGTEQLSFFFLWEPPGDGYALVTVDGYLVLNGYCQADADGGLFGGNLTTLDVDANLDLHGLPTSPLAQDGQYLPAARLRADATGWFSDDVTIPGWCTAASTSATSCYRCRRAAWWSRSPCPCPLTTGSGPCPPTSPPASSRSAAPSSRSWSWRPSSEAGKPFPFVGGGPLDRLRSLGRRRAGSARRCSGGPYPCSRCEEQSGRRCQPRRSAGTPSRTSGPRLAAAALAPVPDGPARVRHGKRYVRSRPENACIASHAWVRQTIARGSSIEPVVPSIFSGSATKRNS